MRVLVVAAQLLALAVLAGVIAAGMVCIAGQATP